MLFSANKSFNQFIQCCSFFDLVEIKTKCFNFHKQILKKTKDSKECKATPYLNID